jgi:beta-glucanase (GH16 family)
MTNSLKRLSLTNSFAIRFLVISAVLLSCGNSSKVNPDAAPKLSIQGVTQVRGTSDGTMRFYVTVSKATNKDVSADYTLVDGTAVSSKDFVMASGVVTIPANQTQGSIDVQIKGDPTDLRQPNLEFTVALSNPKSCTLGTSSAKGTLITENGTYLTTDNTGYSTPSSYPGYTLVWSDEFSATSFDNSAWNAELGNGSGGWGNNELEYYTGSPKNVFLSNGNLIIEARKEAISGFNYSSARLTTQSKKVFKYGRIDIRAKLPVSKGMWPALWMLGTNISSAGWPGCGEIDIMELVGTYPSRVRSTMHWKSTGGGEANKGEDYNLSSSDFSQSFHVFSLIWQQDSIKCYVDDVLVVTVTPADLGSATWPFNADQFFIFNVAVGGNWPGPPDSNTVFPQRMFVDYVRVFQ